MNRSLSIALLLVTTAVAAAAGRFQSGQSARSAGNPPGSGVLPPEVLPEVALASATPRSGLGPLSVSFSARVPRWAAQQQWHFGDGTFTGEVDPSHVYSAPGTYRVLLLYREGPGAAIYSVYLPEPIVVHDAAPELTVDFTALPGRGPAPLLVGFSASASEPLTAFSWSFGDGSTSSSAVPSHTYSEPGTYSVSLTGTSASGSATETKREHVVVEDPADPGRRNVLLILADDIGTEMLDFYGEQGAADFPATPVLASLAQDGLLFENAWSMPYCSPTRATLLTGRYGFRTGIGRQITLQPEVTTGLPHSEVLIPRCLPGSYRSSVIGKWHLEQTRDADGCDPVHFGFDLFDGTLVAGFDYYRWERTRSESEEDCRTANEDSYLTTANVDSALNWIHDQSGPWFCYLALQEPFNLTHTPPPDLQYRNPPVTACGNRRRCAKAAVEAMDSEIGRLLAGLGPDWQQDTTVIFAGDNGTAGAYILRPFDSTRAKGTVYERGVNVPLVFAGAGVAPGNRGRRTQALAHTVDMLATVCALTDGTLPTDRTLDSVDLTPVLTGPAGSAVRSWIYAEVFENFDSSVDCIPVSRSRAIRDERFKLLELPNGWLRFYDLQADPLEELPLPLPPTWEPALSSYNTLQALLDGPLENDC